MGLGLGLGESRRRWRASPEGQERGLKGTFPNKTSGPGQLNEWFLPPFIYLALGMAPHRARERRLGDPGSTELAGTGTGQSRPEGKARIQVGAVVRGCDEDECWTGIIELMRTAGLPATSLPAPAPGAPGRLPVADACAAHSHV